MPTRSEAPVRHRLHVVLVQYDRTKYPRSLRRLLAVLERLQSVDSRVVVVDNALEGRWYHEITDGLAHLAGDNERWEFSGFDRGVAFARQRWGSPDLWLFVTDALTAYGDGFLELVDDPLVELVGELGAAVGWVDSIMEPVRLFGHEYDSWLRTSFVFVPAPALLRVEPLAVELPTEELFGDLREPLRSSAPMSSNLKSFLATWVLGERTERDWDTWHSAFDLDVDTWPRFQEKVLAILREHFLSLRWRQAGVPVFDLRLLADLAHRARLRLAFLQEHRTDWQWLGWRNAPALDPPHAVVDRFELPATMRHGDPLALRVWGWVLADPQPQRVTARWSTGEELVASVSVPRPDVLVRFPGHPHDRCGFELEADLGHLSPGTHLIELDFGVPELPRERRSLVVEQVRDVDEVECFVAEAPRADGRLPVQASGRLRTSEPLEHVEVRWDGEVVDLPVVVTREGDAGPGPHLYRWDLVGLLASISPAPVHRLSLSFGLKGGEQVEWGATRRVSGVPACAHSLTVCEIGTYDPTIGGCAIHFAGLVHHVRKEQRLELHVDGRRIDELFLDRRSHLGGARFDLRRNVPGVGPGEHEFILQLAGSPAVEVRRWRVLVSSALPSVQVSECRIESRIGWPGHSVLRLTGWVSHSQLVTALEVFLDGNLVTSIGFPSIQCDWRPHVVGEPSRQTFEVETNLEAAPGRYPLEVVARGPQGVGAPWHTEVDLESSPGDEFLLRSEDLASWRVEEATLLGEVAVGGVVVSPPGERWSAELLVDDEVVDRERFGTLDRFRLRHRPLAPGVRSARLRISTRGRQVFDSGEAVVRVLQMTADPALVGELELLAPSLGLVPEVDLEELAVHLLEHEAASGRHFRQMVTRLTSALVEGPGPELVVGSDLEEVVARPLRVLFASWEVPCLQHGGGVCLTNLLRVLGARHEITLVHSHGEDEVGLVEDVRPFVQRVVSVPRDHRPIERYNGDDLPLHVRENYTAALARTLAGEARSGDYDLANFEYASLYPYLASVAPLPASLVVHEGWGRLPTEGLDPVALAAVVARMIRRLHFLGCALPAACDHLVAFTPEDGVRLATATRVFLNPIGVDVDDRERSGWQAGRGDPTFVFLGNYRHPPNVEAVRYFAGRVLPRLAARVPGARFQVVGRYPPPEVVELASSAVEVVGEVPDFRPYLDGAVAFVAPIRSGAGMRVKVLEALACGIPVIGTGLAFHGIGGEPGRDYLVADEADELAQAAARLAEDPELASRIGTAGRELVRTRHRWETRAREREAIWAQVLAATGRRTDGLFAVP